MYGEKRFPYEPGNCLSACVASILELPITAVPNFIDPRDDRDGLWAARLDAWLAGLGWYAVHAPGSSAGAPDEFCIAWGLSVRGRPHAVVAAGDRIVHDPDPKCTGLETVLGTIFLAPAA